MLTDFLNVTFTKPFNYAAAKHYMSDMQMTAFWISMGYIVVIFGIKKAMENRKPFDNSGIKLALNFWNLWLAVFSIAGSYVTSKALYREISKYGLTG